MPRGATIANCLATLAVLILYSTGFLEGASHLLGDFRYRLASRNPSGHIVLVEIDSRSIKGIGYWPWSRSVHAAIIDRLQASGASEIAFDVDFSSSSSPEGDAAFEAALARAGDSVVLAAFQQKAAPSASTAFALTRPLPRFLAHGWEASVEVEPDRDGRVRRVARSSMFEGSPVPSLAGLLGGTDSSGTFSIDFGLRADRIDRVSVIDLLRGDVPRSRLEGKGVIVGASAVELRDFFNVPRYGIVSGPLLQALAAESLREHRDLKEASPFVVAGLVCAALLLGLVLRGRVTLLTTLAVFTTVGICVETSAALLQSAFPIILDTAPVQAQLALLGLVAVGAEIEARRLRIATSQRDTRRLQQILDRVILDNFAGIVVADPTGRVRAVSHAAAELLGLAERQILGRHVSTTLPEPLCSEVALALEQSRRGIWVPQDQRHATLETAARGQLMVDYVVTISQLASAEAGEGTESSEDTALCLTFLDVTERRTAEARLTYLAHFDELTGLLNRHAFAERLWEAISGGFSATVIRIDLDRFRLVNNRVGQSIGDELLKAVATRLMRLAPDGAQVARLGADEFVLLAYRLEPPKLQVLCESIVVDVSGIRIEGYQFSVGASCGSASLSPADQSTDEVMQRADAAVRAAKAAGGGRFKIYDAALDKAIEFARMLEQELEPALHNGEFEVFYQRQCDARTERIIGVEALLRWKHPRRGYVSPGSFIPAAERTGFIVALGAWVLASACREVASWPGTVKVAVNLSAVQFSRGDLLRTVVDVLRGSGLPPERLELELTESLLIEDDGLIVQILHRIRDLGIGLALDDFGTGYSSLAYLRRFPITKIKIDQSFVRDLHRGEPSLAILEAVMALGRSLGLRTNAEGVETAQQLATLRHLGCDEVQGYLHGRPEPGWAIAESLREQAAAA